MAETLGSYRLLTRLGAGGFGEVHLALDPQGRTVAVKVLHPHIAADAGALARLGREMDTMRRVRGRHIAEVLDFSADPPYLVTRYVQGRPLTAVAPLAAGDLLRLARGLASALSSVHVAGVVHRDLKPANVILADGEPVVIDFGVAFALDSPSVTASGTMLGTPGYLAPEVLQGNPAGPEADVFSFAATLAFAATGRQPYGVGPAPAVAYRVVHRAPDLDGVPAWLEPLLHDCLAADPSARPSAAEVCARVGAIPEPPAAVGSPSRPASPPEREAAGRGEGVHGPETSEWRPGDRAPAPVITPSDKLRNRWVIGGGVFVGLTAATAFGYINELGWLLLLGYAGAVLADIGAAALSKTTDTRRRVIVGVSSVGGTVALAALLSALFSPVTLAVALGVLLALLVLLSMIA
ncbi:serine/threonine-protein kinase [Rhizohabitans arisaemae]|uniref:serine/threonine-protein kinase n=1 Tax=Rhizohabitans arisaemae TaxID=2720610 RepID=UPI0024B086C1|nr:serine/threonine-protein kinase [Rhizohabitans arisaemae]